MTQHKNTASAVPIEIITQPFDSLLRVGSVEVETLHLDQRGVALRDTNQVLNAASPEIASVQVSPPRLQVFGRLLPEGETLKRNELSSAAPISAGSNTLARSLRSTETGGRKSPSKLPLRKRQTRIKPPADVVKLEDRLQYLLQPPLESLIEAQSLRFPFHPFPYQLDGVAFLYPRQHAVLADEMGLGKTMQSITTLRLLAHSGQLRRALLVCPKPLVTNWQRELSLWAPELSVATVEGPQAKRLFTWCNASAVVTIANYETVVRDQQVFAPDSLGQQLRYDLVMLDESQRIKNPRGATSNAVRSIQRGRSWALTGTPIENSTDDLAGIFDFVSPGMLRPGMKPRAMGAAVRDCVLRRTKDRVLTDLPPKVIRDVQIDLTPEQWESYQRAEGEGVLRLGEMGTDLSIQHVFELVLRLKQICNFDPATGASSKLQHLEADLEECAASGRKAIVFSQWVESIEAMADKLRRFNPAQYHGRVPHRQRDGVIDRFRNDPDCHVILMSYGAGSVGLNLQFASYVFLFDRWWNPAVEDQAINRAHRIGAAGPVTVTRMIAGGTIEGRIDEVLAQKRELFASVFESDAAPQSYGLSRNELLSLFDLHSPEGRVSEAA